MSLLNYIMAVLSSQAFTRSTDYYKKKMVILTNLIKGKTSSFLLGTPKFILFLLLIFSISEPRPLFAADLVIDSGNTLELSGSYTYDKVVIDGDLILTGDTVLTINHSFELGNYGSIESDVTDITAPMGTAGVSGTSGIQGYPEGTPGGNGENGADGPDQYSLSITVNGDAILKGKIDLSGSYGSPGRGGGYGGNGYNNSGCPSASVGGGAAGGSGGNGGRGGNGGHVKLVVNGTLQDLGGKIYVDGGRGGDGTYSSDLFSAGTGGSGGSGYRDVCTDDDGNDYLACTDGREGAPSGTAGKPGNGGAGGDIEIWAENIVKLQSNMKLALTAAGARGGEGSKGGSGGSGGSGGGLAETFSGSCCSFGGSGAEGSFGTAGGDGGAGGNITVHVSCNLEDLGAYSPGGPGEYGGRGGGNGRDGSNSHREACPNNPPGVDGIDGAQGGKGGDGGHIVITASGIGECDLGSRGGNGDEGGDGTNAGSPPWPDGAWGTPGNGGDGGAGGKGGTVQVTTPDITNTDIVINTIGGKGGLGGGPGDGEGDTTGTPGESGSNGTDGVKTLREMTKNLIATLSVDKTAIMPNHQITYTIGVSSATSQTNLLLSLPIPANTTLVTASAGYTHQGGALSWDIVSLTACKILFFSLTVLVDVGTLDGTIISNTGTVSSNTEGPVLSNTVNTKVVVIDPAPPNSEESQLGNTKDTPYPKDPVNPATGNYVYSKTFFILPSKSLPVTFSVIYNSSDNTYFGPLGFGWTHTYNIILTESGNDVTIKWGDGHEEVFKNDGKDTYSPSSCYTRISLKKNPSGGYEATQYNGVKYIFDNSGRLSKLVDTNGNEVILAHSTHLDKIVDTGGREINFTYISNLISGVTISGKGESIRFVYDGAGDLTSLMDFRGNTWQFTYDASHRNLTLIDAKSALVNTNVYDADGRIIEQKDGLNHTTIFEYSKVGSERRTKLLTASGHTAWYHYDENYNLLKVIDGESNEAQFSYDNFGNRKRTKDKKAHAANVQFDSNGNPISVTDRLNVTTLLSFGINNRLTQVQDGLGNTTQYTYDTQGNLTSLTNVMGAIIDITRNASGQATQINDPLNNQWQLFYNDQGLIETVTTSLDDDVNIRYNSMGKVVEVTYPSSNDKLQFGYDENGNLIRFTDAPGNVTTNTFDPNNNLLSTIYVPTGATTTYTYNVLNQLIKKTDPLGGESTMEYNIAGSLSRITDPDGVSVELFYDSRGLLTTRKDVSGQETYYRYDVNGNLIEEENHMGRIWILRYDDENRFIEAEDPTGAKVSFTYDNMGRVLSLTDREGHTVQREYDAYGQVTKSIDPDGSATQYSYDLNGNLVQLTDSKNYIWKYGYDALNRMISRKDPLGRERTYMYDNRNRLIKIVKRDGKTINYEYDQNDRLVKTVLPGVEGTTEYTYDVAGNLTQIINAAGTKTMSYDLYGRKISTLDFYGNTLQYRYTPGGRLAAIIYPDNKEVNYSYDSAGRLIDVSDWLGHHTTYSYDSLNQLTAVTMPNGTSRVYSYDCNNRLVEMKHKKSDNSILFSYKFTRDRKGKIVQVTEETAGVTVTNTAYSGQRTFSYDAVNRISTKIGNGITTHYAFDLTGNVLSKTTDGKTTTYTYDSRNRLRSTSDGIDSVSYTYGPGGSRIAKTFNTVETRYLKDGDTLLCKLGTTNTVQRYYIYAGSLAYSLDQAGEIHVYHGDSRGSVVGVTDSSQNLIQSYAYSPYGMLIASQGNLENEFRYIGTYGVTTDENGLYFMSARYYDPEISRFITEDPSGLSAGINLYGYVQGDPINRIDPCGLAGNTSSIGLKCPKERLKTFDEILARLDKLAERAEEASDVIAANIKKLEAVALRIYQRGGNIHTTDSAGVRNIFKALDEAKVSANYIEVKNVAKSITNYALAGLEEAGVQAVKTMPSAGALEETIKSVEKLDALITTSQAMGALGALGKTAKVLEPVIDVAKPFAKKGLAFLPIVGLTLSTIDFAYASDEVERSEASIEMVFGEIPGCDWALLAGNLIRLIPGVDERITDFARGGYNIRPDNTLNLIKLYQQKYQHEHDIAASIEHKIQFMKENMALDAILSLTCP